MNIDAQLRVDIAKDVLTQIKNGKIIANSGQYLIIRGITDFDSIRDNDLKSYISNKTCEACAIGSLFVAAVSRFNEITVGNAYLGRDGMDDVLMNGSNASPLQQYLSPWFSGGQLAMIEYAFEGMSLTSCAFDINNEIVNRCKKFCDDNPDVNIRLELIMDNIIANDGDLVL